MVKGERGGFLFSGGMWEVVLAQVVLPENGILFQKLLV